VALLATIAVTTVVWVTTTFLTKPADRQTLVAFFRLIRPSGPGWKPVAGEAGVGGSPGQHAQRVLGWVAVSSSSIAALFGAGSFSTEKPRWNRLAAVFIVSASVSSSSCPSSG